MKNVLFASTALVAFAGAASAAEPMSLTVSGYMNAGVVGSNLANTVTAGVEMKQSDGFGTFRDGEIHFNASGSSDNGLTFSARVELEAFTTGDQIDKNFVRVAGDFGMLTIGQDGSGGDANLATGVIYSDARISHFDDAGWDNLNNGSPGNGDGIGVYYRTPNISGFLAEVYYVPDTNADGALDTNGPSYEQEGDNTDLISIGGNYRYEGEGMAVQVSGGYANSTDDAWSVGARGEMGGFVIGAWYGDHDDTDGESYIVVNGSYSTGPWTVGAGYANVDVDKTSVGDTDRVAGWVSYAMAPGVTLGAAVSYANQDGDNINTIDDDAVVGALALNLSF